MKFHSILAASPFYIQRNSKKKLQNAFQKWFLRLKEDDARYLEIEEYFGGKPTREELAQMKKIILKIQKIEESKRKAQEERMQFLNQFENKLVSYKKLLKRRREEKKDLLSLKSTWKEGMEIMYGQKIDYDLILNDEGVKKMIKENKKLKRRIKKNKRNLKNIEVQRILKEMTDLPPPLDPLE